MMRIKLNSTEISDNWNKLLSEIENNFPTRKDKLLTMYNEFEERIALMPASSMDYYHNAFPGGYVKHILHVMKCADLQYNLWKSAGADMSGYTYEELLFAALNHDLGKIGFPGDGNEVYQTETSDWHRKNLGRLYKKNSNIPFTTVPDLSLWLLQKYNIPVSWNEYQAIKIHDGLYDDSNKAYFISRSEQSKLKTNMPLILHHADHMAAQIEYEEWRNASNVTAPTQKPKSVVKNSLKNLGDSNPKALESIANLFADFNKEES